MTGLRIARIRGALVPELASAWVGISTTIRAGDVLVLTSAAGRRGTAGVGTPALVVRSFGTTASDKTNLTVSNGILGIALYDIKTDANGALTSMTAPSGIDASVPINYQMSQFASLGPLSAADAQPKTFWRIPYIPFQSDYYFFMESLPAGTLKASQCLFLNVALDALQPDDTATPTETTGYKYYIDPATNTSTLAPFKIAEALTLHTNYALAGGTAGKRGYIVQPLDAFSSHLTGVSWST